MRHPPLVFNDDDFDRRESYMKSFMKCLHKNKNTNVGTPSEFVLLYDLFRIIASEWVVFNTYVERELNNIERWFENHQEQCPNLHYFLNKLMTIRRRVTKYETLVRNQLQQCPHHWNPAHDKPPTNNPTTSGRLHRSPLVDFDQVLDLFSYNQMRNSEAIKVATSLMTVRLNSLVLEQTQFVRKQTEAVEKQTRRVVEQDTVVATQTKLITGQNIVAADQTRQMIKQNTEAAIQNKLAEARNASLAFLTLVTSIFLPFTTVAAAMSIPAETTWRIGGEDQWKFWVSASCFALMVLVSFAGVSIYHCWKVKREKDERLDPSR
jgi:Mg2+ and Co2+ transporter CorA